MDRKLIGNYRGKWTGTCFKWIGSYLKIIVENGPETGFKIIIVNGPEVV